jgi:hypothetical protein
VRVIQIRVLNGTVIDVLGQPDNTLIQIYDQDLVDEPDMAGLTKIRHPDWGDAIVSTYNPDLQEPWR